MKIEDIIKEKSLDEDLINYVEKKLSEKGINLETQDEVIKYLWANKKLFGHVIDTKELADRIIGNLDKSIVYFGTDTTNLPILYKSKLNIITSILSMAIVGGYYQPYDKEVYLNPLIQSKLTKNGQMNRESILMHEIDHCATTSYIDLDEQQTKNLLLYKTKKGLFGKIICKFKPIMQMKKDKWSNMTNNRLAILGFENPLLDMKYNIPFWRLDEGITVLKQKKFSEVLGIEFNKLSSSSYQVEPVVAEFIANKVGLDNLIKFRHNNDYEGLRKAFFDATGKDLNDLVSDLNKIPLLLPISEKRIKKRLNFKQYDIDVPIKKNNTFVQKVSIDNSEIGNNQQQKLHSFEEREE